MDLASGTELGFVDSYKYNIAAYQLAEMLGLDDIVPIYVDPVECDSASHWPAL